MVGVDSLGWLGYIEKVMSKNGVRVMGRVKQMLQRKDKVKEYWRVYHKKAESKARRKEKVNLKIQNAYQMDKIAWEECLSYEHGMALDIDGLFVNGTADQAGNRKKRSRRRKNDAEKNETANKKKKNESVCGTCGRTGHSRITSKDCLKNNKTLATHQQDNHDKESCVICIHEKQQAQAVGTPEVRK